MSDDVERMRASWDERARAEPMFFIDSDRRDWDPEAFRASGERFVAEALAWAGIDGPGARALEIGCGLGRNAAALAARYARVDALDISPEMLARAERAGLPENVHLALGSGRDLAGLPGGAFDLVFSALVLQHVPADEHVAAYLREIARVLRRGGRAVVQLDTRTPSLAARAAHALPDRLLPPERRRFMRRARRPPERVDGWIGAAGLRIDRERGRGTALHWYALYLA
jgi:SAM-dependent methyltransferase